MIVTLAAAVALSLSPVDQGARSRFYADMAARRYEQALSDGGAYRREHPGDWQFALDYAYALCDASRIPAAVDLLRALASSPNASVAQAARSQLAALGAVQPPKRAQAVSVSGYAEPDSRYRDTFYGVRVVHDFTVSAVRPFAMVDVSSDTRSGAPETAPVFNTDTLFAGAGFRTTPASGVELRVAGGEGMGLRGQRSIPEIRAQASLWHAFGIGGSHAQTSIGVTSFYSSRFAGNVMTYATLQHDVPLSREIQGIFGVNAAMDVKGLPYNNFAEVFGGAQLRVDRNATLRFDVRHGQNYTAGRAVFWFSAGAP